MADPVKARDVMADADNGEYDVVTLAENMVVAPLAQTPEGEGVYIAPDGTLMGRCDEWPTRHQDHYCDDPDCDGNGWVPIEGADRD